MLGCGAGGMIDTMGSYVWEPAMVKANAITAATEAACLVLSVDETVRHPFPSFSWNHLFKLYFPYPPRPRPRPRHPAPPSPPGWRRPSALNVDTTSMTRLALSHS